MKSYKQFTKIVESIETDSFRPIYAPQEIYGTEFNNDVFDLYKDSSLKTLESKINNLLELYDEVSNPSAVINYVQKELMKVGLQVIDITKSTDTLSGKLVAFGGRYGQLDDSGEIGFDTGKRKMGYDILLTISPRNENSGRTTLMCFISKI